VGLGEGQNRLGRQRLFLGGKITFPQEGGKGRRAYENTLWAQEIVGDVLASCTAPHMNTVELGEGEIRYLLRRDVTQ